MIKLYKHQAQEIADNRLKWGLFYEFGCGKTLTAIELAKKNKVHPLVIVPKGLATQWEIELSDKGLPAKVITKETFRRDHKTLNKFPALIIDEVHYFGHYTSQMAKSLAWYIKEHNPKYIWGLTGTPYLSTPWNIWTLARILGHDWNYHQFDRKFFYKVRMGLRTISVPKTGMVDELTRMTRQIGSVVKINDCVDIPPAIEEIEYLSLTPEQVKAIKVIRENEILVLPKLTREHQVCGGTIKDNPYLKDKRFKSDKVERTISFVEEQSKSIIVCRYNEEVEMLSEILPVKSFKITGAVDNRYEILQEFERAEKAVLLVNAACSEGWEVVSASSMLFYSMGWSVKDYLQMAGRIRRINHPRKLYYRFLICKGEVDEDIYNSVVKDKMDFYRKIQK